MFGTFRCLKIETIIPKNIVQIQNTTTSTAAKPPNGPGRTLRRKSPLQEEETGETGETPETKRRLRANMSQEGLGCLMLALSAFLA